MKVDFKKGEKDVTNLRVSMDGMVVRSTRNQSPLGVLLFGLLVLLFAVIGTFTGKVYGRGGSVDRTKNPVGYWICLVAQYAAGAFLLCLWASMPQ
jgi:hypothetical protein